MGKYSKDRRDIFYRRAKEKGYRARSSFKLIQIDHHFGILKNCRRAVDLCAAPGGWSQVLSDSLSGLGENEGKIIAVDLQSIAPINGVRMLKADITDPKTHAQIVKAFDGQKADLVLSDGAPDATGLDDMDYYVQNELVLSALKLAVQILENGGTFLAKIFRGKHINCVVSVCKELFENVCIAKPTASRNYSIGSYCCFKTKI
ncbi:putative tRNA (cytidine(32)/guanosine(34)-2'-O)-methyltransferase, variant 2 [Bonamia ostreae]|uniref:tRNA (Cytidine(32)/guanosine(34)-2'-O)-methyltransferase, variant 2 n=1 Tax=Bonamia ostreae TaxID=126728 RepID=A0ABV2AKE5_9EUKA